MKKEKKLAKKQLEEIESKLCESIKYIEENVNHLKKLENWERYSLQSTVNRLGFSMVETNNLNTFYQVQDFCNSNQLTLINHNF